MSSKACHMVGEMDLAAKVQLSIISKISLYKSNQPVSKKDQSEVGYEDEADTV